MEAEEEGTPTTRYPDYCQIVQRPMDLKTLRKNVIDNKYEVADEFYNDAQLIFDNCKLYTVDSTNPIRNQCDELERNFMYQWQNFIARRHEEQALDHVDEGTAEVLSMVHSRKRKPEPELVTIVMPPPPPVKRPKPPKTEEGLSVSIVIPEAEPTPPVEEVQPIMIPLPEKEESSVVVKFSGKDFGLPAVAYEEELDMDKGKPMYESVIKFTVPEIVPEPPPSREIPVVVSIPAAPVPASEEYIRAALSSLLSAEEAKVARRRVVEVLHKYSYTFIPLDSS